MKISAQDIVYFNEPEARDVRYNLLHTLIFVWESE